MEKSARFIIWREKAETPARNSVRTLLNEFPKVQFLKSDDPNYAIVLMDVGTEKQVRKKLPELWIEEDVQYSITSLD